MSSNAPTSDDRPGPDHAIDDPALPAAGLLVGSAAPELARTVLRDMATLELRDITIGQIHYLPGYRIRVLYNVEVVYPDGDERYEDLIMVVEDDGVPEGAYTFESPAGPIGCWRYPWDPLLPGLQVAWDLASVMGMLEASDIQITDPPELSSMSYSPTKHAVLRVEIQRARTGLRRGSDPQRLYLKVVRPPDAEAMQRRYVTLAGLVRAPRCLAWSGSLGLILMDEVPGRSVWALLVDGEPPPPPEAFLEVLDRLATADLPGRPLDTSGAIAVHSASILKATMPEEAERIDRLVAYYAAEEAQPLTTIHGDFHEDQVLFAPDGSAGIVDLDEVGPGQQIDDMAMLVGRLWSHAPFHGEHGPAFERYALELFDAFARRLGSGQELHRRCGANMFGRSTNPYRYVEDDWRATTRAMLDLCERWIAEGPR